ncbi:MAG: hypothetical protein Kow0077_08030 [Anaerolineae bacterium]
MAREILFDGRYRYDHIYPRGRSGEALRAYDIQNGDREVVIKRPAPQDAPPIRAGQEVNIRTERRALQTLEGHPVLTAFLAEGTFRVGGQTHLYIVLERARGVMLEDEVLELAKRNERLPELEMLVIVDSLLDLLAAAHEHEIVYNDVDAKHLFWDRDSYQLKVIDWGNAVFLEGDEVTPQGISRQTDVYQVGELLYFLLTGGQRLLSNGTGVDFGEDAARIPTRLQHIVQRAVHPALEQRYPSIEALREDLAQYRRPLERDRAARLERIERRLQRDCSQQELERLKADLVEVLSRDPGYPPAREYLTRIEKGLNRLAVLADLDAIRIYLENAQWSRALPLLESVLTRAEGSERTRARVLFDVAQAAGDAALTPVPLGLMEAVNAIYADRYREATRILQIAEDEREAARDLLWILAERIHAHVPEAVVLRPHLLRIQVCLEREAQPLERVEILDALEKIEASLAKVSSGTLESITAIYAESAAQLGDLASKIAAFARGGSVSWQRDAEYAARQAAGAAQTVAAQLEIVAAQATASPDASRAALLEAILIDPANPAFERVEALLEQLQRYLQRLETYRPQANGADLLDWLRQSHDGMKPYLEQIGDPRLGLFMANLEDAARSWQAFHRAVVFGNREAAVKSLERAADAIRRLNPDLAVWLTNVRDVIGRARYVQRHALNASFGRSMADGWMAWDRGSGIEAERLGRLALEEVTSDEEAAAADRLIRLGKLLRTWKEGNGEGNPVLTEQIDQALMSILTPEEDTYWQQFTSQMPDPESYLAAMPTALVDHFEQTSTAALRVLFFHCVLRGVLDMYDSRLQDAEFWQKAAALTLPNAEQHIAYMALSNVMRDRQAINDLVTEINAIASARDVTKVRGALERSPLQLILKPVIDCLRQTEHGIAAWEQGDLRGAGESFEQALELLRSGEQLAHLKADAFREWLSNLHRGAAELDVIRQRIAEAARHPDDTPRSEVMEWHVRLAEESETFLGKEFAAVYEQWRDTYAVIQRLYSDPGRRRSRKLRDIDETLNRVGRIDRHPAFPLFQRWRETVYNQPEYPVPPGEQGDPYYEEVHPAWLESSRGRPKRGARLRALLVVGMVIVVVGALGALIIFGGGGEGDGQIPVTWETATPTIAEQASEMAASPTVIPTETPSAVAIVIVTDTPPPADTAVPSPTATLEPPTAVPTATLIPTLAPGDSFVPTVVIVTSAPTATATPAPAAAGGLTPVAEPLSGRQNILFALEQPGQGFPWPEAWFRKGDLAGSWVLGVAETDAGENLIQVVLPAELLATYFGPDAAVRLRRLEATLTLQQYDPALIEAGMVYFGLGLRGADESRVAVQAQLIRPDAMNVGARVGDEFRARTTLPVSNATVRVALERYTDGTVGLFLNGDQLGSPRFLTAPNAPVTPFLFVQEGGVVITVTDLVAQFD